MYALIRLKLVVFPVGKMIVLAHETCCREASLEVDTDLFFEQRFLLLFFKNRNNAALGPTALS